MKPFSTSFKVASKRLVSNSLSPKLCTDSRRISRMRSKTLLRSSKDMVAGLNFWEKTPGLGKAPVRSNLYSNRTLRSSLRVQLHDEQVKEAKTLVFQNFCFSAERCFHFSFLVQELCCQNGPSPNLFCTFFGNLVNSLACQVRDIVDFWRARDIPPFGSAEFASMWWQRGRIGLVDELLKLWN